MGQSIDVDYVVEREGSRWTVNFQGQHCGHFPSCRAALHSAVDDADRVRRLGHRVHVLVRRADGHLRAIRDGHRYRPDRHVRPPNAGQGGVLRP